MLTVVIGAASSQKAHEDAVGCGRAIMFFEVRIRPMPAVEGQIHRLVFVEEYWPLPTYGKGAPEQIATSCRQSLVAVDCIAGVRPKYTRS